MAKLSWIIFGIFVVCCSAHFGLNRRENFPQRQTFDPFKKTAQNNLLGVNREEKKCFTLARRPFYMTRLVHYPCNRQRPDVPVVKWFMGKCKHRNKRPNGPICVSYFREPVYRYFRIPMCCPGFTKDRLGKCTIRTNQLGQNRGKNNEEMMSIASKMRQAMWLRAKEDMERRRAKFFMNMRNNRRNNMRDNMPFMMHRMQLRRPPMTHMFNMYNREQITNQPRVAFLRFNRPTPPMPHPVQQPPLSGRMVKIIKRKIMPLLPFMQRNNFPMSDGRNTWRPPMVPRIVLSNRAGVSPMNRMREFHPPMPQLPRIVIPRIQAPFQPLMNNPEENFSNNPEAQQPQPDGYPTDGFHGHHDHFHGPQEGQMTPDNIMQVDLPIEPVQMPNLVVEQTPTNNAGQESCIVRLEAAVKTCLKQNKIDVPDVMSAFEPFNDDKSRILCQTEDSIFNCINDALMDCQNAYDAAVARDMLLETAETVQSMCDLRQANVGPDASTRQDGMNMQGADTVATVENVDAIPTDVNAEPTPMDKGEITIIEESPALADTPSAEAVKEAIQHEVHVQEMRMKEYLLPILIGSGLGFMLLVLCMSLIICCCCKRRFRQKMKMAKEMEKPPLKDVIYTIGVAPPTYEVNGIPPMYYEEAKGEKITSRSASVLEGSETEDVQM